MPHWWRAIGCCFLALLAACGRIGPPEKEGALVLGMVPEPVIPHYDGTPAEGYTRDFARMFGEKIGLPVRVVFARNYDELTDMTRAGKVHVAAYINASPEVDDLKFSVPFGTHPLWVVKLADAPGPQTLTDLDGLEIHVPVGSAAGAALKALAPTVKPKIVEVDDRDEMDLFDELIDGKIKFVATDQLYMLYAVNTYPDLQPTVRLPGNRVFSWVFPPPQRRAYSDATRQQLNAFISMSQVDGTLPKLRDTYFGYIRRIDAQGAQDFIADIGTKLPPYRDHFHKAQDATGIDWRQLAALAYQESKWEPKAVSFTGVQGLMMLTMSTAASLGIKNRGDPAQSVKGGSRYLADLMSRIPDSVKQPDRLWMALAAYNIGLTHLLNGRRLAEKMKKNPDLWFDVKSVLPLLSRPQYYVPLKMGRARGGEAVILVENVRSYYGVLANIEPAYVAHKKPTTTKKLRKKRAEKSTRKR